MHPVIENYEALSTITAQMREAALQNEWDHLVELEKQCTRRVALIKALDNAPPLDENTRQCKAALIRKILADDADIRNQAEPWMEQLKRIMQSTRQEQRLLEAYSSY